jgi:hypothetical protein
VRADRQQRVVELGVIVEISYQEDLLPECGSPRMSRNRLDWIEPDGSGTRLSPMAMG